MSKSWDNNILKKLKALMGKGLSTSEIGKRLGLSKNAVVGKLHRMGWNAKATEDVAPVTAKKTTGKKVNPKKVAPKKAEVKKETTKKAAVVNKEPAKGTNKKVAGPVKKANTKKTTAVKTISKAGKKTDKNVSVQKKEDLGSKKVVGRAISGRNTGMHQRVVQHALEMANLKPDQCRWPIGDPDSDGFHFCGATVFVGKPYCYEHCQQAYQFVPPKKK